MSGVWRHMARTRISDNVHPKLPSPIFSSHSCSPGRSWQWLVVFPVSDRSCTRTRWQFHRTILLLPLLQRVHSHVPTGRPVCQYMAQSLWYFLLKPAESDIVTDVGLTITSSTYQKNPAFGINHSVSLNMVRSRSVSFWSTYYIHSSSYKIIKYLMMR